MGPIAIMIEAGAGENATITPDGVATVIFPDGGHLSFAPALDEVFESGEGEGWDFTVYDADGNAERQDWVETDDEMIAAIRYYVP